MKSLVAVDGSEASKNALKYAADIADAMDGSITVVHAVDPTAYDEGGSEPTLSLWESEPRLVIESVEDAEARGQQHIEDAANLAAELGHDVAAELLYGNPVVAITTYAEEEDFDTVFVGHRGRSGRTGMMLGSVAKSLVERATVPVTVVR